MQQHLLHLADSHFSHRSNGRIEECERVHYWALEDAEKRGATHGAHSGDVYHDLSDIKDRLSVWKFLRRASQNMPWVVAVGNHDAARDLDIASSFGTKHPIHVAEMPERYVVNGVEFLCLPDTRRTDLVRELGADGRSSVVSEAQLMDAAKARITRLATEYPRSELPRVLLCHAMITEARPSNDQPIVRGVELNFKPDDFAPLDCDVYLFGHVHAGQSFRVGNRLGYYPGAPFATTYGELGLKRYLLVHMDGHHVEVEPVEIPAVRLVLLMASLQDGKVHLEYGPEHNTEDPLLLSHLKDCDVRVRMRVPEPDRLTGERALGDVEKALLEAGAVKVKPELLTEKQNRARVQLQEIKKTTLSEEVQSFWDHVKKNVPQAEQEAILALVPQLEEDIGREGGVSGLLGFEGINAFGVAPYYGKKVHFAMNELPSLVAVNGQNGAGKSMLLGLLIAGAYGEHPVYGSLDSLAVAPNAALRVRVKTATERWDIYQDISAKQTRVFRVGEKEPVFAGGPKKYAKWVEENLPAYESVFYGSFLTTKEDSIGKLRDAKLKSVVMKSFRMGRYELLASSASKRANKVKEEHIKTKAQRDILLQTDPAPVREEMEAQEKKVVSAEQRLSAEQKIRATHDSWSVRSRDLNRILSSQAEAELQLITAQSAIRDADKIRNAESDRRMLEKELLSLRGSFVDQEAQVKQAHAERQSAERSLSTLRAELAETEKQLEGARRAVEANVGARDAAARKPFCQQALAATERALQETKERHAALCDDRVKLSQGRATALREGVEGILTIADEPTTADKRIHRIKQLGQRTLLRDQTDVSDLDIQIGAEAELLKRRESDVASASKALREVESRAAKLPLLEKAEANVAELKQKTEDLAARIADEENNAEGLALAVGIAEEALAELKKKGSAVRAKTDALTALAGRYQELLRAEGTIDALKKAVSEAKDASTRARAACGVEPVPGQVESAFKSLQSERQILTTLQERLRRVEADAIKASRLEEQLAQLEVEAARWMRAAEVFGRDGLQAVAVETVCNQIAQTATDLFHRVCGPTWSIRFASTRGTDGKVIEQARWMAINHADGKEREVKATSGGEEVMLTNAILFAYAAELQLRMGHVEATAIVDETSGALRGDNLEKWVALLRAGCELAQMERVLMVPPDSATILHISDMVVTVPDDVTKPAELKT